MDERREKKWVGNIEMKKEKKENLSCRKHFKGAEFSFRSGIKRVQIA